MSDNQSKMTLEEKIVQSIKNDTLYKLVGDEDAITQLVERAVKEALFQPVRIPLRYGGYDEKDSIVVATAREVAEKATNKIMEKVIQDTIENNPELKTRIMKVFIDSLPAAAMSYWTSNLQTMITNHQMDNINMLKQMLEQAR